MTLPPYSAMTASAAILPANRKLTPKYDSWQGHAWDMYDGLGELEAAVSWKANAMSRVRLVAAEVTENGDEPTPLKSGPAAEAMMRLAGGTGGQTQLMRQMTIHLSVPGEGWLVGEATRTGEAWRVYSADELKVGSDRTYKVKDGPGDGSTQWRNLSRESIVVRFWEPHPRRHWEPDSETRHALGALTELDLINKRIIAEITSRLASNGILLYNKAALGFSDGEQPSGPDVIDRLAQILVDVATPGIADPQSPQAVIPIPIGFDLGDTPLADINPDMLMKLIKVSGPLDEKLLTERDSAIRRLAINLDIPPEILLGVGDLNHWSAWAMEDTAIKIHVAPKAETICHSLTKGYLEPTLAAAGESLKGLNGGQVVVWYDPSEITTRPDHSADVIRAYEYGEVPGRVLRREIGLAEKSDAPTRTEFLEWMLKYQARQPQTSPSVLAAFGGPDTRPEPNSDAPETEQPREPIERADDDQNAPEGEDLPVDMAAQDTETLTEQLQKLMAELDSRGDTSSQWFDSAYHSPSPRVTPVRRNGKVETHDPA